MKKLILTSIAVMSCVSATFLFGSNPAQAILSVDDDVLVCTYTAHDSVFAVKQVYSGLKCPDIEEPHASGRENDTVEECTVTVTMEWH